MTTASQPLSKELRYTLSWEAATERFIAASRITKEMKLKSKTTTDKFVAWVLDGTSCLLFYATLLYSTSLR